MENFNLKQNEEFFSILDKVKVSRDENIALIIPAGMPALKSIVNLRILKEESGFWGKNIFIITSDPLIKRLTQQAGIKILDRNEEAMPNRVQKQMGRVVDLRPKAMADVVNKKQIKEEIIEPEFEPEIEPEPEPQIPIFSEPLPYAKKEKIRVHRKFKFTKKVWISGLIAVGVLALAYVVYFVLPRAQVLLDPKTEQISFNTELTVDKGIASIDTEANKVPGQLFQLEDSESKDFPTTGEKDVQIKAQGTVTIYNQYSSSPQTLVKTTRLKSKDGKIFRLVDTITIPGASIDEGKIIVSSIDVQVIADEVGDAYNIGSTDFTIPGFEGSPKYSAFYGKSTQAMSGGAKGKMKVATKDDIDGATNIVVMELKDKAAKEFQAKIPQDLKLIEGAQSIDVIESTSTLKADQPGDKFTISVKVRAAGLAFKEQDIIALITKTLDTKISENKILLPSTIKIDYSVNKIDLTQGSGVFACKVGADAAWNLDTEKIKSDLAGKSEVDVRKYLASLPELETAKVIFWPFWVKKIPSDKNKIKVTNQVK